MATITSPGDGTKVSKTLKVAVSSSDNVGVIRVELYLDGALAGTSTASSALFTPNTSKWLASQHRLKAGL